MSKEHPDGTLTSHFEMRKKPKKDDAEEQPPVARDGETAAGKDDR